MSEDMVIGSDDIMEHAAEAEIFLKQFANKTRLMVLCTELLEVVSVSQPVISQHLALLRESKMVATRRQGQTIYYRLADERVKRILSYNVRLQQRTL